MVTSLRLRDADWLADAACAGTADPGSPFFDEENPEPARSICDLCPVRDQCMLEAVHYEGNALPTHRYGVWAGFTPAQRYAAQKRRSVTCPVCGAAFDPALVRQGVVRCPVDRRHMDRTMPAIPDDGDDWSRRHTILARRVLEHWDDGGSTAAKRPRQLAREWRIREQDMVRVYEALVLDGSLQQRNGWYRRAKGAEKIDVARWHPSWEIH